MLSTLNSLFIAAVLAGTPLLLGALGEILTEKSGNMNLGVEGMMFMGAITGLAGSEVGLTITVADWESPVTQQIDLGA